jgi:hypothetical protein
MKKSTLKISDFFLILGLCWISIIGNSQDLKLDKKEKKEARKAERLKDYEALGTLLESRKFVFEADRISSQMFNNRISPDHNYIRFDTLSAFIQFERTIKSKKPLTWEGNIVGWELEKNDKKLYYDLKFNISTVTQNYYMFINYDSSANLRIGGFMYLGYIK